MKILITGASKGVGAATAIRFGREEGNQLFLVSRNKKGLDELKKKILSINSQSRVHIIDKDLEKETNISSLVSEIKTQTDYLDILINNAGFLVNKGFKDIRSEEINRIFTVNYTAPAILIRDCYELLKNSQNSHIVNISSMGGVQGSAKFPGLSHYSSAKAAIAVLTECLAEEFKGEIKVNCLALGAVQTEMLAEAFPGYNAPLQPEEMAEYIYNFSLTAQKYMNGKIIPVSLSTP